jgi:hypothetical protein
VEVAYIVEEVDFLLGEEQGYGDGVDGGVTPALHKCKYVSIGVGRGLGGGLLHRRNHLLCRGGRSRLDSFRFAIDLGMRFQSLTTIVRSEKTDLSVRNGNYCIGRLYFH